MRHRQIIVLLLLLTVGLSARAQLYRNNFDDGLTCSPPWTNLILTTDSTQADGGLVCLCDSTTEYGLGFVIEAGKMYPRQNIRLKYSFQVRTKDAGVNANLVFSIDNAEGNRYWNAFPMASFVNDTTEWSQVSVDLNIPSDYIGDGMVIAYIWNPSKGNLWIDDAELEIIPWEMPSFLGTPPNAWGMLIEYIIDDDTVTDSPPFTEVEANRWRAVSGIDTTYLGIVRHDNQLTFTTHSRFYKGCKLLRQTLVIPFPDSTLTVFRKNMAIDTSQFQSEYYLDREGFKIGQGDRTTISYHQTDISSTQLDAVHRVAYFNLDYWRDHPLIHYPMSDTLEDYFEDASCRHIDEGMSETHSIKLYVGEDVPNMPRIMKIPYGYASGIIFTEHADWTDIRTHRAVLFGSEKITRVKDAKGGFVYYGIPVTKSVFYNNPDQVTNDKISHGRFKGLHATIQTDREFKNLLKQLYNIGFDICLHTPEQYTTTPNNLREAMRFMRRNFRTVSWIDHGYNNGPEHNREDLVCNGLDPSSEQYAAGLWRENGVKYLWNAYYEENRMEQWRFDCNLMQPYPGFGDALPNRQIFNLSPLTSNLFSFYAWCTPSTLEAVTDDEWDFYYSAQRLQRLVDNHDVHITHIYPAWVRPGRTFWTYDEDSTIVALAGMNRAFERIAQLRDEHQMLPMTIKTYLDYYTALLEVDYEIVDAEHIRLCNHGSEVVEGFTLLCPSPIRFDDGRFYEFRKSGNQYYVWFDLKPNETILIKIIH